MVNLNLNYGCSKPTISIDKVGKRFKLSGCEYEVVGIKNSGGYMTYEYKSVLTVKCLRTEKTTECLFKPQFGTYQTILGIRHGNMVGWVIDNDWSDEYEEIQND